MHTSLSLSAPIRIVFVCLLLLGMESSFADHSKASPHLWLGKCCIVHHIQNSSPLNVHVHELADCVKPASCNKRYGIPGWLLDAAAFPTFCTAAWLYGVSLSRRIPGTSFRNFCQNLVTQWHVGRAPARPQTQIQVRLWFGSCVYGLPRDTDRYEALHSALRVMGLHPAAHLRVWGFITSQPVSIS